MAQMLNFIRKFSSILEITKYFIGPILFLLIINAPLEIAWNGKLFLGIFSIVISLWLLTPVPLFISGLFGVSLSVIMGVTSAKEAFAPFSNTVIFLFLGGFLLARALEKTELDKLLAKKLLHHPWVSSTPQRTILAFLWISFFLSMWISNTAAVAMLLPISYGVLKKLDLHFKVRSEKFQEKFLIAIAFAATVGGNVTPIGSPPNVVALGFLKSINNTHISFLEWMAYATPFSLILFYLIYRHCLSFLAIDDHKESEADDLPDFLELSRNQKYVLAIFAFTVFFWFTPSLVGLFLSAESLWANFLRVNLSAAVVSVFFAATLHVVPFFKEKKVLDSSDVSLIDWSSLLLFGAGLSLGSILFQTGGADYLMTLVKEFSGDMSVFAIVAILLSFTIFFTEVASNTATANIILPVVIALGLELNYNPTILALSFAFACNSAFMLPVATPPNTIVFGTNKVSKLSMIKSGIRFNFIGLLILILMNWFLK